jgi:hypothetical protein
VERIGATLKGINKVRITNTGVGEKRCPCEKIPRTLSTKIDEVQDSQTSNAGWLRNNFSKDEPPRGDET